MRLLNKLVVITAAASGMGRAGVELFAREGATVAAIDINADGLRETVQSASAYSSAVHPIIANLGNRENAVAAIRQAADLMGGIDVLWSNVGIPGPSEVEGIDYAGFDLAMELNLAAGVFMAGEALPYMRKRGAGSIIFTSSVSGIVGSMLSPIYSAGKFAIAGYAKSLALRTARDNIRVNAICPGMTQTGLLNKFMSREDDPGVIKSNTAAFIAATPLGRIAQPIEIAHGALWLASDESSYVTGITLPIDGGLSAK